MAAQELDSGEGEARGYCPDDGDLCTQEVRVRHRCVSQPAPDGTPCPSGSCVAGRCLIAAHDGDRLAPTVAIAAPAEGEKVSGTVVVSGSASDDFGIAALELQVDAGPLTRSEAVASFSFALDTALYADGTHTLTVRATDAAGNVGAASRRIVFANTLTVFSGSPSPAAPDTGPDSSVELGMKFWSEVEGAVLGVRYFKAEANTGTHTGALWSASGVRLAEVTFTGESPSGWQEARFASPVRIAAETVYVVSYHSPSGHYSDDVGYFAGRGVDNPPLHAPADGVEGPNGVFAYGSGSVFPAQAWQASNYWVDVVLAASPRSGVSVAVSPASASLLAGGTQQFTAAVSGASDGAVRWSVQEAAGGTINASGLYTAPALEGTYHVVATSVADPARSRAATVTVAPLPQVAVQVSPGFAALQPGGSQQFAAAVTGTDDPAVTWSVREAGGGTVSASGLYGAPQGSGTFHVIATSVSDPSKSAAAIVSVGDAGGTGTAGLIPAERVTTWDPGLNAVGGIPLRTTIYKTLSPSGGDDTGAIQSALDSCPADQVVQLAAGTFKISGQGLVLNRSNVTLRGQGPQSTKLVKTAGTSYPVLIFGERWYRWLAPAAFATDAVKGARRVTLARDPGVQPGELVHVNETYDSSLTWYSPSRQTDDYLGWGEGRTGSKASSRPIGQAMEVERVQANEPSAGNYTVTFTTPFHISFRASRGAHLVRLGNSWPGEVVPATKWSGVEDLYVANGEGADGGGNIRMFASAYCWARNIESDRSKGASFAFDGSFRCELRDSYLHSTVNPSPGGEGYGIVVDTYSADCLVENNISWNFNKVMAMRSSGGGNVIGYNYMEDGYGSYYPTIVETGLNASHMTTPHMELFEGNQSFNFDSDSVWGNSIYITVFRNHLTGLRRSVAPVSVTDQDNRRAVGLTINHWWYSFLGNVLGFAGMSPQPSASSFSYDWQSGNGVPMWQLGYNGETWDQYDTTVVSRTLRHGNFDFVTQGISWDPALSRRDLPPSLYLKSKPAFFGASAWPWVTPEASVSAVATLPARARFDALHAL